MSDPRPRAVPPSVDLAPGVPYSYAAVAKSRTVLVFTAGACPLDDSGATVAVGDVEAQAETVMENLRSALHAAGAGLDDVVKTTVYVASSDRADLVAAWRVVHRRFGSHEPPSTLLGVSALGYPDQLVEVEAVAAVAEPDESRQPGGDRNVPSVTDSSAS
jgi:enamine deaminase RidA (YjgF/YER057c/UK114 family)